MQPNALASITIKGFKSINSIEKLPLNPLNVLIGANGSGKSNFLGAFTLLQKIRDGRLAYHVRQSGGAEKLLHFGSKRTDLISLRLDFCGGQSYAIQLAATPSDGLFPATEAPPGPTRINAAEAWISNPRLEGPSTWIADQLDRLKVYHFNDTSSSALMLKTARVDDNRGLNMDASNLAAFLYLLKLRYPTSYDSIEETVRIAAPFFDRFHLQPLEENPETIKLEWRHNLSEARFTADQFSDGTLRFIALATLFLQPTEFRASTVLVDEPELGLHPSAITLLAALIRQATQDSQVIVSTQSPILVDRFNPEDILVAERVSGQTILRRLDRAPLATWLEDYSLGELWQKNEFGGLPRSD